MKYLPKNEVTSENASCESCQGFLIAGRLGFHPVCCFRALCMCLYLGVFRLSLFQITDLLISNWPVICSADADEYSKAEQKHLLTGYFYRPVCCCQRDRRRKTVFFSFESS